MSILRISLERKVQQQYVLVDYFIVLPLKAGFELNRIDLGKSYKDFFIVKRFYATPMSTQCVLYLLKYTPLAQGLDLKILLCKLNIKIAITLMLDHKMSNEPI